MALVIRLLGIFLPLLCTCDAADTSPQPPVIKFNEPSFTKVFNGYCGGRETEVYDTGENPAGTDAGRIQKCAEACTGSGKNYPGFVLKEKSGECWCQSETSPKCERKLQSGSNDWKRYDFVDTTNTLTVRQGDFYTDSGAKADTGETVVVGGDTVNTLKVGSYTVTYEATNGAGNKTLRTRTIEVVTRPACKCKDQWVWKGLVSGKSPEKCAETQLGCTADCSGGGYQAWCIVTDPNCATAIDDDFAYAYCVPPYNAKDPTRPLCVCATPWTWASHGGSPLGETCSSNQDGCTTDCSQQGYGNFCVSETEWAPKRPYTQYCYGDFQPLQSYSAGPNGGQGTVAVVVGSSTTKITVSLNTLAVADETYPAHLHADTCANDGGGHYQNVEGGAVDAVNEAWPTVTTDTNFRGTGTSTNAWTVRGAASRSVVVHGLVADSKPKMLCADLTCGQAPRVSCPSTYACKGRCFHQVGNSKDWWCHADRTSFTDCSDNDVFCETEYDCASTLDSDEQAACAVNFGNAATCRTSGGRYHFCGNQATAALIPDTTAPKITLVGSQVVTLREDATYTEEGATVDSGESVTIGHTVDTSQPGTYTVTYDVTDLYNNKAVQVTRTVIVKAYGVPPIITTAATDTLVVQGNAYTIPGAKADTGESVKITIKYKKRASQVFRQKDDIATDTIDTMIPGFYEVTYTAEDAVGTQATPVVIVVTVEQDDTAPIITLNEQSHYKVFDGYCEDDLDTEIGIYKWCDDNPGTDEKSNVAACAKACRTKSVTPFMRSWDGYGDALGFAILPKIGRCWCQKAPSATCTRKALYGTSQTCEPKGGKPSKYSHQNQGYQRFDFTRYGAAVTLVQGDIYADPGATSDTNEVVTCTGGDFDTGVPGLYTITCRTQDAAGNVATPVTRTVVVTPREACKCKDSWTWPKLGGTCGDTQNGCTADCEGAGYAPWCLVENSQCATASIYKGHAYAHCTLPRVTGFCTGNTDPNEADIVCDPNSSTPYAKYGNPKGRNRRNCCQAAAICDTAAQTKCADANKQTCGASDACGDCLAGYIPGATDDVACVSGRQGFCVDNAVTLDPPQLDFVCPIDHVLRNDPTDVGRSKKACCDLPADEVCTYALRKDCRRNKNRQNCAKGSNACGECKDGFKEPGLPGADTSTPCVDVCDAAAKQECQRGKHEPCSPGSIECGICLPGFINGPNQDGDCFQDPKRNPNKPCQCQDQWTLAYEGGTCGQTQGGCTSDCSNSGYSDWCLVTDSSCSTGVYIGGGQAYSYCGDSATFEAGAVCPAAVDCLGYCYDLKNLQCDKTRVQASECKDKQMYCASELAGSLEQCVIPIVDEDCDAKGYMDLTQDECNLAANYVSADALGIKTIHRGPLPTGCISNGKGIMFNTKSKNNPTKASPSYAVFCRNCDKNNKYIVSSSGNSGLTAVFLTAMMAVMMMML